MSLAIATGPPINPSVGSAGGSGDVVGPSSSTNNAICRYDSTTGKLLKDSVLTVADTTGDITAPGALTISTAASNGDITLDPHGTGVVKVDEAGGMKIMGLDTDASNYERLSLSCDGTADCTIATETAGTGGDNVNLTVQLAGTGDLILEDVGAERPALKFSSVSGAPMIYRNGAALKLLGNDSSEVTFQAGIISTTDASNTSYFVGGMQIGNSKQITFSDGTDFNRGISKGTGQGLRITDGSTGIGNLLFARLVVPDIDGETTTAAQSATVWTNTGDGDGEAITLLNDPTIGVQYCFAVDVAQTITVALSTGESLYYGTDQCVVSLTSNSIGSTLCVTAITGGSGAKWFTMSDKGAWTCND